MPRFEVIRQELDGEIGSPLLVYQNVRNLFSESLLLECLEYKDSEKTRSFICADPIYSLTVRDSEAQIEGGPIPREVQSSASLVETFESFLASVEISSGDPSGIGVFGYCGYDAIPFLENIDFRSRGGSVAAIPSLKYSLYRHVFIFDHTSHKVELITTNPEGTPADRAQITRLLETVVLKRPLQFPFTTVGDESCRHDDSQFLDIIERAKKHIKRGDIFQVVLSRQFSQGYSGDEFSVYRALRKINPSPFLFFYDYGEYSLFGSSPEAQLLVKDGKARMFPIAGTYRRGATEAEDLQAEEALSNDPKETSEHVMLVDLARNDLGRSCKDVKLLRFRETERYSHVIHLVSVVEAALRETASAFRIFADTFPAGTLSGAPKHRAMQIIDEFEPASRGVYGGSIGFFSLAGECTQAIFIRSFLAQNRTLTFQAGAGIVDSSVPASELQEVTNKLAALRKAIQTANELAAPGFGMEVRLNG